ncbi:MAG: hypothetical protein ACLFWL_13990 [Candidatus Brocadiia bacterium]
MNGQGMQQKDNGQNTRARRKSRKRSICFKGLGNCVVVWKIAGTDRHHGRQHIGTGDQHYDNNPPQGQIGRPNGTAGAATAQLSFAIP